MLKQSLSQKMMQKLSPQQIQLMKLLQIPTATLSERISEELESNPALEEGENEQDVFDSEGNETKDEDGEVSDAESFELEDYINEYADDDPISYKLRTDNYSNQEDNNKTIPIQVEESFHEYLENQLGMRERGTAKEEMIAQQIIGSIDSDGYLRRAPISLIDDLLFAHNLEASEEEVESVIKKVQCFDPPGIAARNLQECLLIQINLKIEQEDQVSKKVKMIARKIILNHFDEFTKKHYLKLKKHLFLSESELKDAIDEILKLNPKPASGFLTSGRSTTQYIVPDFFISNRDGELELSLNTKNAPDLRVNDGYRDMLRTYKVERAAKQKPSKQNKEAVMFIKQKIDSAKWFIDAIKQRQNTLYNTMYAIMQFQEDYFRTGDDRRLKPMILKDIAEITGLDISTVSRVANSKFVQTEFGTKRLKDFFSESLQTKDGTEVSTLEVKNILSEIISGENKRKPLSDEKLKDFLQQRGYNIARRTVAKYREQLNIPVARLRKEL